MLNASTATNYTNARVQGSIASDLAVVSESITRSPGASSNQNYSSFNGNFDLRMGGFASPFVPGEWVQIDYVLQVDAGVTPGTNFSIPVSITSTTPADPNTSDNSIVWSFAVVAPTPTPTP
jgi:hypothetical protein